MKAIDISVPLTIQTPPWPGETGFLTERRRAGDVAVTTFTMCAHLGTHVDAARHFLPDGAELGAYGLDRWCRRACVIEVGESDRVTAADLEPHDLAGCDAILLRTRNSIRAWWTEPFRKNFVGLAEDGAEWLVAHGIRLIGIDYLSIEPFDSDGTVHRILLGNDVLILEGLALDAVAPGAYTLVCLPLRIPGIEGAPARAVLFPSDALAVNS
jgi:arylformamidase